MAARHGFKMSPVQSETRAELSRILHADAPAGEEPNVPDESSLLHLHALLSHGASGSPDDHRAVYEHLPLLMLRFFGFAPGTGWLETGSGCPHSHREAIMRIVRPGGPIASFCASQSQRFGAEPKDDEWRFEFPLSNLPSLLVDDFYDLADGDVSPALVMSALAPALAPCLRRERERDGLPAVLLLSPVDYFFLCIVSSPGQKWIGSAGSNFPGSRRVRARRSSSLPSTRAMYNRVLAEHVTVAWRQSPSASGGDKSILIPACLDFLFAPLTAPAGYQGATEASIPTVDAMATVLLALRPGAPTDLVLGSGWTFGGPVYPAKVGATAALYATTQDVLRAALSNFPTGATGPLGTLAAYIRLFALYLAPWKESVVAASKAGLYPKPRVASTATASPSLATITSTLSSLNAHLPTSALRSSPEDKLKGEAVWRDLGCLSSKLDADREVLQAAVMKSAHCRLAATVEGVRALSLLGDAVRAAGLAPYDGILAGNVEEVRGSLRALGDQAAEVELRSGRKSKSFVAVLGNGLGIKMESAGMLSGMADLVGVGSVHASTFGMGSGGGSSSTKRRLRDRQQKEMGGASHEDVPFLGSAWERPVQRDENEAAVVLAYKLALRLEPRLGYVPNIRVLGQNWLLLSTMFVFCVAVLVVFVAG